MLVIYVKIFSSNATQSNKRFYTVLDDVPHGLISSTNGTGTNPKKETSTGSKRLMRHFATKGWKQNFIHFIDRE